MSRVGPLFQGPLGRVFSGQRNGNEFSEGGRYYRTKGTPVNAQYFTAKYVDEFARTSERTDDNLRRLASPVSSRSSTSQQPAAASTLQRQNGPEWVAEATRYGDQTQDDALGFNGELLKGFVASQFYEVNLLNDDTIFFEDSTTEKTSSAVQQGSVYLRDGPCGQLVHRQRHSSISNNSCSSNASSSQSDKALNEIRLPVGLRNLGNTCYLNAVMQNLYQTFLFRELLVESTFPHSESLTRELMNFYQAMDLYQSSRRRAKSSKMVNNLVELFSDGVSSRSCHDPRALHHRLCERSVMFTSGLQQDSHDCLRHLLDGVKEEEKESIHHRSRQQDWSVFIPSNPKGSHLTAVDRVFGGCYLTTFRCHECKMPYHLFEPFLDLSLPIEFQKPSTNKWNDNGNLSTACCSCEPVTQQHKSPAVSAVQLAYTEAVDSMTIRLGELNPKAVEPDSVTESLMYHTDQEWLSDYLCLNCSRGEGPCVMRRGSKQMLIYSPPAILTLYIKRFKETAAGDGYEKVSKHIRFKQHLDMAPFCSAFAQRQGAHGRIQYSLYGIVVHIGTVSNGHYTAYVRVRTVDVDRTRSFLQRTFIDIERLSDTDKLIELARSVPPCLAVPPLDGSTSPATWWFISDTFVAETTESEVMKQNAYLLFYERIH